MTSQYYYCGYYFGWSSLRLKSLTPCDAVHWLFFSDAPSCSSPWRRHHHQPCHDSQPAGLLQPDQRSARQPQWLPPTSANVSIYRSYSKPILIFYTYLLNSTVFNYQYMSHMHLVLAFFLSGPRPIELSNFRTSRRDLYLYSALSILFLMWIRLNISSIIKVQPVLYRMTII